MRRAQPCKLSHLIRGPRFAAPVIVGGISQVLVVSSLAVKRRLKTYFIRVSWKCIANTEMEVGDGAGGGGGAGGVSDGREGVTPTSETVGSSPLALLHRRLLSLPEERQMVEAEPRDSTLGGLWPVWLS